MRDREKWKERRMSYMRATTVVIMASLVLAVTVQEFFFEGNVFGDVWDIVTVAVGAITVSMTTILFFGIFKQTPSTLNISVLGYPNSGKTVYLTVLFNELLTNPIHKKISFMTYGSETIERISADYEKLNTGHWLPPTPNEGVFYYRATASLSSRRKYKLEIGDYAGEKFKEELKENNNFFHKTEYFKYVISSDVIFLAIDMELVLKDFRNGQYIANIESSFISALSLMQEVRSMGFNKKIKFPVAIIFLKFDLLGEFSQENAQEMILEKFARIIGYCQKNCINYNHFFVSSTGTKHIENFPGRVQPEGVVEPVEWAIGKSRTL